MNIRFIAASDADDIQCKDGELVDADYLFRNPQEEEPGSSDGSGNTPGFTVGIEKSVFSITAASRFLCIHRPPAAPGKVFAIMVNHEGKIMYADAEKGSSWHTLSSGLPDEIKKCVAVGNFLVFLTPSSIHYAIFEGSYRWLGEAPAPPELTVQAKPSPLPPYSYAAGESPVISVSVGIGEAGERAVLDWLGGTADNCPAATKQAVIAAVRDKFREFLFDVESSNLHFYPAQAVAFYRLPGGSEYRSSTPQSVSPGSGRVSLRIADANCSGSTLYLTLEVSRAPFEVSCSSPAISGDWSSLFEGVGFEVRKLPSDLDPDYISPPVRLDGGGRGFMIGAKSQSQLELSVEGILADLSDHGLPDDIFSIGSRLLAVYRQGASRPSNLISTSEVGWPQACTGQGKVAGAPLLHLTQSLRALSSGQFGEFPLYAFSLDGVRALTPSGGSFRDVQLISRHVPLGTVPFAPTPDATCFITKSGVMKIEGTSVSRLSKESEFPVDENSEIIYSYPDDAVLVKSADGLIHTCRLANGKWSAVSGEITSFHYGWPDTWILQNGSIGILRLSALSSLDHLSMERAGASVAIPIKTRPLKLGDPFAIKKLREAEVIWPNGARLGFRIYGAMQLDKWYFLGASSVGPMRMRGSGWRFFRVETYAIYVPGAPYLLPTLRLT